MHDAFQEHQKQDSLAPGCHGLFSVAGVPDHGPVGHAKVLRGLAAPRAPGKPSTGSVLLDGHTSPPHLSVAAELNAADRVHQSSQTWRWDKSGMGAIQGLWSGAKGDRAGHKLHCGDKVHLGDGLATAQVSGPPRRKEHRPASLQYSSDKDPRLRTELKWGF